MTPQAEPTTVAEQRREAVAGTLARIRDIEAQQGIHPDSLAQIRAALLELAAHEELFGEADYPSATGQPLMYLLSEDPDHRYALYFSSGRPGRGSPPHNHTTWAVIVGIDGHEENRLYNRLDDGAVENRGEVRQRDRFMVEKGTGIGLMPDDIHSIHVTGDTPTRNFHLYGLSIEHLPERIMFNMNDGSCKVFPPSRGIIKGDPPFAPSP